MKMTRNQSTLALMLLASVLVACGNDVPTEQAVQDASVSEEAESAVADQDAAKPAWPTAPLIDPNTASEAALSAIPGLTEESVHAILDGRPFATPSALHAAISGGLSVDVLRSIYQLMFVKVNLNTGANEDFRLVPSSLPARKLAHEFEEYRPYESIDDFVREMKKYVSDEEVAYLTRYVVVE
ncbi:MAG: hypothetical protein HKN35_01640 [Woeseia sp.]|nr:hypothetical protein [Woeseia sp.]